jgi:hypothetical protein
MSDVILLSLSYLVDRWVYLVSSYIKAPVESVESVPNIRIPKREHQTKQEFQKSQLWAATKNHFQPSPR